MKTFKQGNDITIIIITIKITATIHRVPTAFKAFSTQTLTLSHEVRTSINPTCQRKEPEDRDNIAPKGQSLDVTPHLPEFSLLLS